MGHSVQTGVTQEDLTLHQGAVFHGSFADGLQAIAACCCVATCSGCHHSRGGPELCWWFYPTSPLRNERLNDRLFPSSQ